MIDAADKSADKNGESGLGLDVSDEGPLGQERSRHRENLVRQITGNDASCGPPLVEQDMGVFRRNKATTDCASPTGEI